MTHSQPYIRWFKELGLDDVAQVGGKNASLGEMYQQLTGEGVRVPNGFAITSQAYRYVLEHNKAWARLHEALDGLDANDIKDLQARGQKARAIVYDCTLPEDLQAAIRQSYAQLKHEYGDSISLAVRSSATAEDSPLASFAGQNDTYLNIASEEALLDAYKRCLASNFTDRSIHYSPSCSTASPSALTT